MADYFSGLGGKAEPKPADKAAPIAKPDDKPAGKVLTVRHEGGKFHVSTDNADGADQSTEHDTLEEAKAELARQLEQLVGAEKDEDHEADAMPNDSGAYLKHALKA